MCATSVARNGFSVLGRQTHRDARNLPDFAMGAPTFNAVETSYSIASNIHETYTPLACRRGNKGTAMITKNKIKRFVERLTGVHLYRRVPRGIDVHGDIEANLPAFRMNVIFDVGANTGQSTRRYLGQYPLARVYCFEPVQATFHELQKNVGGHGNVSAFRIALGAITGSAKIVLQGSSDLFHVLNASRDAARIDAPLEEVQMDTLDRFCQSHNIDHIDYLKVDTEGGDLDVVVGATYMLSEQRIDLLELEAGMNPGNSRHVPFETLKRLLEEKRYFLFGLYEQVEEWPTSEPHLRRTNPVFISEQAVRANSGKRTA